MEDYTVKSVDKAFLLLEVVSEYPQGVAITELSARVSMYKSTVHRLLSTMLRRGYIEQDRESGRYKLGYMVLDMGMRLLSSIDLRREALPFLQELAQETLEVVHLAFLDRGEVVYIEKVDSPNTIRMHSRVGKRVPVHATGLGKAILAFLPPEESRDIIARYGLPRLTEHTVTDSRKLMDSLVKIRELGYAVDMEENEIGVCCVATPILEHGGKVVAACSVSGPSARIDKDAIARLVPLVKDIGRKISERLGYGMTTAP